MQIVITAAKLGATRWMVFREGADLKDIDVDSLTTWMIDFKPPTTGTLVDTNSNVTNFGVKRNANTGAYMNPEAAPLAYQLSYGAQHITSVSGPDVSISGEMTKEKLDQIPFQVLNAFVTRTDPTAATTESEYASLKRKPNPEAPAGESAATE